MTELVMHPQTRLSIEQFLLHPAHAVVLLGPDGSGKHTLARHIACKLLSRESGDALDAYPYFRTIEAAEGKSAISIEAVRELQQFAKLKLPAGSPGRVIHVSGAHMLTTEAQNALLKLLEEPPAGTMFVMTASSLQHLLPTIRSRVQTLVVHRPSRLAIDEYFAAKGFAEKDIEQAYFLSGGLPGLMTALLEDGDHPMRQAVLTARKLLQMTQFERLALVDPLSKNKAEALHVLYVLQHMAQAALEQTARRATDPVSADKPVRQWHKVLRASYDAEKAYDVSAQAKLTLTNLMLAL